VLLLLACVVGCFRRIDLKQLKMFPVWKSERRSCSTDSESTVLGLYQETKSMVLASSASW
jgi:hypothetical protein